MLDYVALITIAIFLAAGAVKGVVGLGLPTISMGLLATIMPTPQAAAILMLGMWGGQVLREHLQPEVFRRVFFMALGLLGLYLVFRSW